MTYDQATHAARTLKEAGQYEAAEAMECLAEAARQQHFHEMAVRCYDDPDFALSYEEDMREFRA